jgi:addiction module HigA family antidote
MLDNWCLFSGRQLFFLSRRARNMAMKEPPHPGQSVRFNCLEALGLSVTEGAEVLGVSRQALNNLVNGKAGISPEMAIRLDKAFGGSAEAWLSLQTAYNLAQAKKNADSIAVRRFVMPEGSSRLQPELF